MMSKLQFIFVRPTRCLGLVFSVICWMGSLLAVPSQESIFDFADPPQGVFDQQWMEVFLMGQKIGYAHIVFERDGDTIVHRNYSWMKIARDSFVLEIEADYSTVETLDGKPRSFNHTMTLADQPVVSRGIIENGQIDYQLKQGDYTLNETVPFPEGAWMVWGARLFAETKGNEPGTEYTYQLYSPDVDFKGAVTAKVKIAGEETFMFHGKERLGVRKDETVFLSGTELKTQSWADEQGRLLKVAINMAGMPIEMYASDAATALADFVPAELFLANLFEIEKAIPADAKQASFRIRYRSKGDDILEPISGEYQKVKRVSPDTVEVVVRRPNHATIDGGNGDLTGLDSDIFLRSNLMINAEDPEILELAHRALPRGLKDRIAAGDALRAFVTKYIDDKNLNVGFASASEVARDPRGDCTEHAVLLAALGRVHGLPARVVGGLVYIPHFGDKENVMGYHMWTQFYINEHWVDFDAALGESECAPTRIALTATSLDNTSLTEFGMDLLKFLGQIDIELISGQ